MDQEIKKIMESLDKIEARIDKIDRHTAVGYIAIGFSLCIFVILILAVLMPTK